MYEFIKNQWIMGKYTETNIEKCVAKGYISQAQADEIMAISKADNLKIDAITGG